MILGVWWRSFWRASTDPLIAVFRILLEDEASDVLCSGLINLEEIMAYND